MYISIVRFLADTVCLVFSRALMLEKCEALLMLYESMAMALCALRFQLFIHLFRHGLGEIFCHGQTNLKLEANQILKRIVKSHGRAKPWNGMMCENTEVRILIE